MDQAVKSLESDEDRFDVLMGALVGQRTEAKKRASAEAQISRLEGECSRAKQLGTELQSRLQEAIVRIKQGEVRATSLSCELSALKSHSQKYQTEAENRIHAISQTLSEERGLRQQVQSHAAEKAKQQAIEADRLRAKIAHVQAELTQKSAEAFQFKNALDASEARAATISQEMEQIQACYETASKELEEDWANRYAERLQELGDTEERLFTLENRFQETVEAEAKTRSQLESQLAQAQDRVVDLMCELSLVQERLASFESALSSEKSRAESAESFLSRSEAEVARITVEAKKLPTVLAERESLIQRIEENERRFAESLQAQGELRVELLQARREVESLRDSVSERNARLADLERELEESRTRMDSSEVIALPEEVATALAAFDESQRVIAEERAMKANLEQELAAMRRELASTREAAQKSNAWVQELKSVARGLERELKPGSPSARKFSLLSDLCSGEEGFFEKSGEDA